MLILVMQILYRLAYIGFWLTIGIPLAPWIHDHPSRVEPGGDREELRERPLDVVIQWVSIVWWLSIPPLVMVWLPLPWVPQIGAVAAAYLVGRRIAAMRGLAPGITGWWSLLMQHRIPAAVGAGMAVLLAVVQWATTNASVGTGTYASPQIVVGLTWLWVVTVGVVLGVTAIRELGPQQSAMLRLRGQIASVLSVTADELRPSSRGKSVVTVIPDRAAIRTDEQIETAARTALSDWEIERRVTEGQHQLWLHPVSELTAARRKAEQQSAGLLGDLGTEDVQQRLQGGGDLWDGWKAA